MPTKVTEMSAARVPARILRLGKEHAQLVEAGITTCPSVSSRAPDMWYSIKEEDSRDIGKMMGIPPLRGRDINNLSSHSTNKISNMSNTSRTSQRSSKT
jgi:hypothetical protein